jgi:pyrimidine-specific ribonucleoside hydrolase
MVSGTGEVHCKPGVRNMLDILEMLGEPEIPVTCGRETPLSGDHAFPDSWREGADTLYGVELPAGTRQPYPGSAVELIQSVLVEADQPITLLTLGPLTNPGEALEAHPELAAEIERIYIMGGAVGVPGNVGPSTPEIDNQVAEWNIYADPHSANLVLRSGAAITLVPLDATNFVPVSMAFLNRLEGNRATPAAQLAYDLMAARRDMVLSGTASFWDILTAATLLDGSLASYKIGGVVVEEAEGPSSGQTRLDENGPRASYAVWADRARFEDHFLQALQR